MYTLTDKIIDLVLLDYEITFKKHEEIPGQFVISMSYNSRSEICTLPYSHLSEKAIAQYINYMIVMLGR